MQIGKLAGRSTSRIGMGCGRLSGGASLRQSRRIVEQARKLGITHFDTAPSYGFGTADDVLGDVLSGDNAVTIATKLGIARPSNPWAKTIARSILRPLLVATPSMKGRLIRAASTPVRNQFDPVDMRRSFMETLRRLRRNQVDVVMLHQPDHADLDDLVVEAMTGFVREKLARAMGSGTNGGAESVVPFGTVSQYRFGLEGKLNSDDTLMHGLIRNFPAPTVLSNLQELTMKELGWDPVDPSAWIGCLLTLGLLWDQKSIILVSSNSPTRLSQACNAVNWSVVATASPADIDKLLMIVSPHGPHVQNARAL